MLRVLLCSLVAIYSLSFATIAHAEKDNVKKDIVAMKKITPEHKLKAQQDSIKKLAHIMGKMGSNSAVSFESGPLGAKPCACDCSSVTDFLWSCDPSGCSDKEGKSCREDFDFSSSPAEVQGAE